MRKTSNAAARRNPKDIEGAKKAPLRFVPPALVIGAAEAYAEGAEKYGPFNWRETPISHTAYIEAVERHLLAIKDREDIDPDSQVSHWKKIAATAGIVLDAMGCATLIDDRPMPGPAPLMLAALVRDE